MVQFNYFPTIHAQLALSRNDVSQSIESLLVPFLTNWGQKSTDSLAAPTCPLCIPSICAGRRIWPHIKAVRQLPSFRKSSNDHGIVVNQPIGALAHLQIGRAYAMQGDMAELTQPQ